MSSTHDSRVCCAEHARAGAGLPAIEAGMPAPAGTGLSRRSFLLRSAGLALSVYGAGRLANLPLFEEGIARAQAGGPNTVLVSVFLDGGADSLSILAPTGDPSYRRLRPNLAIPENGNSFLEDPRLTWHPAAAPLARLHDEGKVSVLPAVGYDHPDQSHFVSRHFWEVGALDAQMRSGWLGRVLDRVGTPDNPLQGISLGGSLGPSLAAARVPVAAIDAPEDFGFWAPGAWGPPGELAISAFADVGRSLAGSSDLEARGIADRVLTLVWSEFGRRAAENGSGTDHGAAGIGFVIGTRASGRMIGEFPGLGQLDPLGNLRATSDFRGLYSSLAADWFGVDPAAVLGRGARVARPTVIR